MAEISTFYPPFTQMLIGVAFLFVMLTGLVIWVGVLLSRLMWMFAIRGEFGDE